MTSSSRQIHILEIWESTLSQPSPSLSLAHFLNSSWICPSLQHHDCQYNWGHHYSCLEWKQVFCHSLSCQSMNLLCSHYSQYYNEDTLISRDDQHPFSAPNFSSFFRTQSESHFSQETVPGLRSQKSSDPHTLNHTVLYQQRHFPLLFRIS